jgi:predicted TIM-barrel fold metal-dependent hydrolase
MPLDQTDSRSLKVREQLDHPVIDGDGHTQEYHPVFVDYMREVAGSEVTERYLKSRIGSSRWHHATKEERADQRIHRPPFWTMPAKNTLDLATAMLPNLFRARLDQLGIDFAVVYTSQLHMIRHRDDEIRRAGCRAVNLMNWDRFGPHSDRMTPAAVIPLFTPEEGIEELEFCVNELGYKAVQITGVVFRPVPAIAREAPKVALASTWVDALALDSAYDYDPFWQKCVDLKVAPTTHSSGQGWGSRQSITNYTYNHIGHFAAAGEAFCKALFLGGVTNRFPDLRVGFLEGGVNWAVSLYNDLFEHWEKRNNEALHEWLDPAGIDRALLADLVSQYGGEEMKPYLDNFTAADGSPGARPGSAPEDPDCLDDWQHTGVTSLQDIYDRFVPNFYFGCEADDRTIAHAFNGPANHLNAELKAIFSSDVSHWDVPDMRDTLAEAHELVEKGLITDDNFRDFTFTNIVHLQAGLNRDFFRGTAVEDAAAKVLGEETPG